MPHPCHRQHTVGPASRSRRIFGALHRTMLLHKRLMLRRLSEHGIPPSQAMCLKELGHHDGITQRDLAELLMVSRPTVTVMLKKMEKAGLVTRVVDESDQRYTRIHLTESGLRLHDAMHDVVDEIAEEMFGWLPPVEQAELEHLLSTLNDGITASLEDRPTCACGREADPVTRGDAAC